MAITLKQIAAACAFTLAAAGLCAPASAASEQETHPKAVKVLKEKAKAEKHASAKKARKEEAAPEVAAADEPEPDISDTQVTDYACELNNKITIYTNEKDDGHIALRWKNRLHRLERVGTTTGALRFENPKFGLIWIGIPSKGMLLDSKLNRQLANECKNAEQAKSLVAAAPAAEKKS
jgi:membrane-bound inhibitor of C-type lysozyme